MESITLYESEKFEATDYNERRNWYMVFQFYFCQNHADAMQCEP